MTTLSSSLTCASLAVADLRYLAEFRLRAGLQFAIAGDRAWIAWNSTDTELSVNLARRVLSLNGVETFVHRAGYWYRLGEHLPVLGVPAAMTDPFDASAVSLAQVFTRGAMRLQSLDPSAVAKAPVRLIRDDRGCPKPATALIAPVSAVRVWADGVPSEHLARFDAVWSRYTDHLGEPRAEVLLVGPEGSLPVLSAGSRFWGSGVLLPLGFRLDPDLPLSAVRQLVGATADERIIWHVHGYERIDRSMFRTLDRSRLAMAGIEAGRTESSPNSLPAAGARSRGLDQS